MVSDFKITRIRRGPYFDMKASHIHQMYEIYYLLDGARKMFFDDSIYLLHGGDMVFIPMNTIHKTSHINDGTHERIAITFGDAHLPDLKYAVSGLSFRDIFYSEPVMHFSGAERENIEALMKKLLMEYEQPDDFSQITIRSCLQVLLVCLIRHKHYRRSEYVQDIDTADQLMQKAARYIRGSYREDIDLASIARVVNLSPSYLSKKFKASTGFGYREYLVLVRIQAASAMLLETNKSIAEIALACGFRDSNYFGDAFKREKGVSPSAYRKNNNDTPSPAVQDGIPRRD